MSSDFLEIEVRDKFSFSRPSASHFLGKAHVSLSFLTQDQSLLVLVYEYILEFVCSLIVLGYPFCL